MNLEISGVAITTPFLPPYLGIFASISPKVRETDKRLGNTLNGPSETI